jgi:hypothetical protein
MLYHNKRTGLAALWTIRPGSLMTGQVGKWESWCVGFILLLIPEYRGRRLLLFFDRSTRHD